MMTIEYANLDDLVKKTVDEIRKESDGNVTSFELFINSETYETKVGFHNANELKERGITMRNLKGEWVK